MSIFHLNFVDFSCFFVILGWRQNRFIYEIHFAWEILSISSYTPSICGRHIGSHVVTISSGSNCEVCFITGRLYINIWMGHIITKEASQQYSKLRCLYRTHLVNEHKHIFFRWWRALIRIIACINYERSYDNNYGGESNRFDII